MFLKIFSSQLRVYGTDNAHSWSVPFLLIWVYLCATITPFLAILDHTQNSRISNFKQFTLVQFNNIFQLSILSVAQNQILGIKHTNVNKYFFIWEMKVGVEALTML